MEITGYIVSLCIGISLGLIGSGGSILMVPVLVYLFGIDIVLATTYSLFIVGTTSLIGSISYYLNGWIHSQTILLFGIPSILTVYLTRNYLLPYIPFELVTMGTFHLNREVFLLLLFALLMVLASVSMLAKSKTSLPNSPLPLKSVYPLLLIEGSTMGIVTGLIGAGGGFLMIPVLVKHLKLPMKTAIGTSLVLIALNSVTGFVFSHTLRQVRWDFLAYMTSLALIGILIGSYFSTRIEGHKLKLAFGWFVLSIGIAILVKEALLK